MTMEYPSSTSYSRRRCHSKDRERNLIASFLSMMAITLLCTALAQPRWYALKGGVCSKSYLSLYEFFYIGYFEYQSVDLAPSGSEDMVTETVYHASGEALINCVTPQVVVLFRLEIAFLILAILASTFAFCLDTIGSMQVILRVLRRNAVGSIHTVMFCVTVVGLSYLATTLIQQQQDAVKTAHTHSEVRFDVGFYMVAAAGAVAILATAANLFRRYPNPQDTMNSRLLEDFEGLETFSIGYPSRVEVSPMQFLPPPPPYSP